jgi:cytochrome c553
MFLTQITALRSISPILVLGLGLVGCGAKESADTASTDGTTDDGGADGTTDDGGADDSSADGGADDSSADGGDGAADDGAADGGDGAADDGGTDDGGTDGAADDGGTDAGTDGGTDDGGTDGGTTTGGDAVRGEGLYSACSGCHGADGDSGYAPDLSVRVPAMTEAAIIAVVQSGRGGMPSIYADATDAADVTAYVIATWGR